MSDPKKPTSDASESKIDPHWATVALTDACRNENWLPVCDEIHMSIRAQLQNMNVKKRFFELTDMEQTSLVEHQFAQLLESGASKNLDPFTVAMNRSVDERLLDEILNKSLTRKPPKEKPYKFKSEHLGHFNEDGTGGNGSDVDGQSIAGSGSESSLGLGDDFFLSPEDKAIKQEHDKKIKAAESSLNKTAEAKRAKDLQEDAEQGTLVNTMINELSNAVINMLRNSPESSYNSLDMFLNRPLPDRVRHYIWSKSLAKDKHTLNISSTMVRLRPSIDLVLSRRCHMLLDSSFNIVSSRGNAAIVKSVVGNYMKMVKLKIPENDEDMFQELDHLVYVTVPILIQLKSNAKDVYFNIKQKERIDMTGMITLKEEDMSVRFANMSSKDTSTTTKSFNAASSAMMESILYSFSEPRYLGLMQVSDGTFSMSNQSPTLGQFKTLLSIKDTELYSRMWRLNQDRIGSEDRNDSSSIGLGSHDEGNSSQSIQLAGLMTDAYNIEEFFNECLLRGLSGLLSIETTLFVWDQGFIADFGSILPIALAALCIGNRSELRDLSSFKSACETFISYCRTITVEQLQELMVTHCASEIQNLSHIPLHHFSHKGGDEILQKLFTAVEANV